MFDLQLRRSGTLPISFTFIDYRISASPLRSLITLLVDRLRTHSHRWKHISLRLSCEYFPQLFAFTPCDLSSLERFDITGDWLQGVGVTVPSLILESATNLKSFACGGREYSSEDEINLRWDRLAEVSLEFAPSYRISSASCPQFGYIAQCQNVTSCSLSIGRPFALDAGDYQFITLPCLQTLRVRRLAPWSHVCTVIDRLILPQLQTLEIGVAPFYDYKTWTTPWHDRNFSNLLARSGSTLRDLLIRDVHFPNDELIRCLARSPMLNSLGFFPCPRSQDIAEVIRRLDISNVAAQGQTRTRARGEAQTGQREQKHRRGPLVPALCKIMLASSVGENLDLMVRMFRSRLGARACGVGVASLRRVGVIYFYPPRDDVGFQGNRLGRAARLRRELERLVFGNGNDMQRLRGMGDEERLEVASVVVDLSVTLSHVWTIRGGGTSRNSEEYYLPLFA